ncbi:MAG: hypothetical protein ABI691_12695 [Ginsengibacter sp.]
MAKKRFISSILLCAFSVIFAHSIIPHHHHEEESTAQHQGSHDDDHEDIDHDFLGEAFSHFQHEAGSNIVYETASPVYQFSKVNLEKGSFFLVAYIVEALHKPPLKHRELYTINFSSSSYSGTSLLRGPPVSLA